MNNNNNINIGENILLKIIKLNKNKIKFKNNEIEKKTKILSKILFVIIIKKYL